MDFNFAAAVLGAAVMLAAVPLVGVVDDALSPLGRRAETTAGRAAGFSARMVGMLAVVYFFLTAVGWVFPGLYGEPEFDAGFWGMAAVGIVWSSFVYPKMRARKERK